MVLESEKLMGFPKAAMISDSTRFWKRDGHRCVFGCYPSTKHSLHKAIHCVARISLDQSSSFVLESFVVQHPSAAGQSWQCCCFPTAIQQCPSLTPSSFTHFFLQTHECQGRCLPPHRLWTNPVWFGPPEIYPWAHQPLCTLWIRPCPAECGRNSLRPYSVPHQFGQISIEQPCSTAKHMHAAFSFWIVKLKILSMESKSFLLGQQHCVV